MKKIGVLFLLAVMVFTMCACTLETPMGKLSFGFDPNDKSDDVAIVDGDGNRTVIHVESLSAYVDQLLDSVALPNGASTDELKSFVYDSLDGMGIDLDRLDNIADDAELQEIVDGLIEDFENTTGVNVGETTE